MCKHLLIHSKGGQDKSLSSRKNSQVHIWGLITGQLILFGLRHGGKFGSRSPASLLHSGHEDQVCKVSGKNGGGGLKICKKINKTKHNRDFKLWLNVVPLHQIRAEQGCWGAAPLRLSAVVTLMIGNNGKKTFQCIIWLKITSKNKNVEQIIQFTNVKQIVQSAWKWTVWIMLYRVCSYC